MNGVAMDPAGARQRKALVLPLGGKAAARCRRTWAAYGVPVPQRRQAARKCKANETAEIDEKSATRPVRRRDEQSLAGMAAKACGEEEERLHSKDQLEREQRQEATRNASAVLEICRMERITAERRAGRGLEVQSWWGLDVAKALEAANVPASLARAARKSGLASHGCSQLSAKPATPGDRARKWAARYEWSDIERPSHKLTRNLAIDVLLKAQRKDPKSLALNFEIGLRYAKQQRPQLAIRFLERTARFSSAHSNKTVPNVLDARKGACEAATAENCATAAPPLGVQAPESIDRQMSSSERRHLLARTHHILFELLIAQGIQEGEALATPAEGLSSFNRAAVHIETWLKIAKGGENSLEEVHQTVSLVYSIMGPPRVAEEPRITSTGSVGALLDLQCNCLQKLVQVEPAQDRHLAALGSILTLAQDLRGARQVLARMSEPRIAELQTSNLNASETPSQTDWSFDEDDDIPQHAARRRSRDSLHRRQELAALSLDRARLELEAGVKRDKTLFAGFVQASMPTRPAGTERLFDGLACSMQGTQELGRLALQRERHGMGTEDAASRQCGLGLALQAEAEARAARSRMRDAVGPGLPPLALDPASTLAPRLASLGISPEGKENG